MKDHYICRKTMQECTNYGSCYPAPTGPGVSKCAVPAEGQTLWTIDEIRRLIRDEMIRCKVITFVDPD